MRFLRRVARGLRRSPASLARRALRELAAEADRFLAPRRRKAFDERALLAATDAPDIDALWSRLAARPFPAWTAGQGREEYQRLCSGDAERIRAAAAAARDRRVALLGSRVVELGRPVDWSRDFRSGLGWPAGHFRTLRLVNPADASDVKVPWELSRLQWLIPVAQDYLLSGDEADARAVRDLLEEWIAANPYAGSVNWGCAMEAAMRVLSWSFFFHAFKGSVEWKDRGFRGRFLRSLYLHGDFVERHLEWADVNGNHLTADAAGLVFAALFFGQARDSRRWAELGWSLLTSELGRQVLGDGVDFESSTAYHRLVLELFLLPALYREACGLEVPRPYWESLAAMARFVAAYTRPDGTTPFWGDADDGRALPLGGQGIGDHRYLLGLVGAAAGVEDLREAFAGPRDEIVWLLGPEAAGRLPDAGRAPGSRAFREGGVYVMRNDADHVFLDCGPVGMAGRGGHGHNDCLSFEAVLGGKRLVADCGTYTYTSDPAARDRFRSTSAHNTPRIDGEEINRIPAGEPWTLVDDARPELRRFEPGGERDVFVGSHTGYRRLDDPVTPVRTLVLDHRRHALVVRDAFEARRSHRVEIPLHLAPGVEAAVVADGAVRLDAGVLLAWGPTGDWRLEIGAGQVSPSYGVAVPVRRLAWHREGALDVPLVVCLVPGSGDAERALAWARDVLAEVAP